MDKLLRFVEEPDVGLLDNVVAALYQGTPQQREMAHKVLTTLQEHPQFWSRVDTILEYSRSEYTKYYALQNLESLVKFRWKVVPREQTVAIKSYIVQLILKLSSSDEVMQANKLFLQKLNICLVQIIKQEWPRQWESLLPEIVQSSQTSDSVCENNMAILKLLSEEIFDFSSGQMTQAKIAELKNQFNKEFSLIYKLCEAILENSQRPSLVFATLDTLLRFLTWIPLGYIFETKLIDMLVYKFLPVGMFRNVTLKCLTEIGSLQVGSIHDIHFAKLYCLVITQLRAILPLETDIASAYQTGSLDAQKFVQDLALFFSGFFKAHLLIAEKPEYQPFLMEGHAYLAQISLVPEVEIFKICLEYWNILSADLYNETPFLNLNNSSPRRAMYAPILSKVRLALIARMPKPEEVLVVEDDSGGTIREVAKDVDAIQLYKTMKETLVYLTHLDPDDTQAIMLDKLQRQVNGAEWSWHNLNTLNWAIGSISGAISVFEE
jgi:exportin-1